MKAELGWLDDPRVFRINRLDAHSDHCVYAGEKDLADGRSALEQSLNGQWRFRYRPVPEIPEGFGGSLDVSEWDEIPVPGHIELAGYHQIHYTNSDYPWEGKKYRRPAGSILSVEACAGSFSKADDNPTGLYTRNFPWTPMNSGDRAVLRLDGAEQAVYVFVNGSFAGYAEDSFTPSEFDITDYVREGENTLGIAVLRHCTASWTEDQDFFRFFGLFRDVTLCLRPAVHLTDIHVMPSYHVLSKTGALRVDLLVDAESLVRTELKLTNAEGEVVAAAECSDRKEGRMHLDLGEIGPVEAWDYGSPVLYRAEVRLYDADGLREIGVTSVGFRHLELRDGVIFLNGRRLILCGVNRHEWSADKGRAIGAAEMESDIRCLQKNHINAVRTCHYPDRVEWYRLCDENGIYVMAETNLESHGSWQKYSVGVDRSWNIPGGFEAYRDAILDRAVTNYELLKNHPSILFWSLGNESCAGEVLCEMNHYYKSVDSERLTHYESVFYTPEFRDRISDVESRMYADPETIRRYLDAFPDKPYVLCEYMHDMGNSMGGLKAYTDLLDEYPMYHGGFIWDMIDQALWVTDEVTGRKVLRYGGDFDDRHSDREFSGNGILFADRTEKPAMQEVRELYGRYVGSGDGKELQQGQLLPAEASVPGEQASLDLVFGDSCLGVRGTKLQWIFSYAFGGPESLKIQGTEWIFRTPGASFWRATTCNDRGNAFPIRSSMWMGADLFRECIGIRVLRDGEEIPLPAGEENNRYSDRETAGELTIEYRFRTATVPATEVTIAYRLVGEGQCRVTVHYFGRKGLPELPVLGFRLTAPTACDYFEYEGLSGETYPDRMNGGRPGVYRVQGMPVTPYLVPQDCGIHMNTRSLRIHRDSCLNNAAGGTADTTLVIRMDPEPLAFSCLPYTAQELESAFHLEELPPVRRTVLMICGRVRGVGGINSWGADVEEAYRISAEEDHEFSFVIDGDF